jgi:hypothetical protein
MTKPRKRPQWRQTLKRYGAQSEIGEVTSPNLARLRALDLSRRSRRSGQLGSTFRR